MNTQRGFLLPVLALLLFACGSPRYADGVFTGRSGADDTGAYADVTLTIQNGLVAACRFVTIQKDGTVKDENYGKVNGEISSADYYAKAQLAVRAMKTYEEQYLRSGSLDQVDVISGATIAYNQFTEAVENALGAARK
ncbi:MAG: FMN-binding protein [Treponema sp.]|jgi:major membrane immunogen (membrane-anchored lipoprotein)|nr:FMN-binding protein [Treponema sp.]